MNIRRDTLLLQFFASHQNATIELHHTLAVTIYIMKRKHHTHIHRIGFLLRSHLLLSHIGLSSTSRSSSILLERNKDSSTFLEHISFLLHFRVGFHQFRQTQSILIGDTENRILFLYRIDITPFSSLAERRGIENNQSYAQQDVSHFLFHFFR